MIYEGIEASRKSTGPATSVKGYESRPCIGILVISRIEDAQLEFFVSHSFVGNNR